MSDYSLMYVILFFWCYIMHQSICAWFDLSRIDTSRVMTCQLNSRNFACFCHKPRYKNIFYVVIRQCYCCSIDARKAGSFKYITWIIERFEYLVFWLHRLSFILYRNFWLVQGYLILIKTEDTLVYHTYNREKKYIVRFDWFLHNQLYSVLQHLKVLLYHQVWACCHLTTDTWNILFT